MLTLQTIRVKKLTIIALCLCLILALLPRTIAHGVNFADVPPDAWYAADLTESVRLGLIRGRSETTFAPEAEVSLWEAVTIAARIHSVYYTGEDIVEHSVGEMWFAPYEAYAITYGLLSPGNADFGGGAHVKDRPVTRARFAGLIVKTLPSSALAAINNVSALPDVNSETPYQEDIFTLYRAGILTGKDEYGTFYPDAALLRSEVCAVVNRMFTPLNRKRFELTPRVVLSLDEIHVLRDMINVAEAFGFDNEAVAGGVGAPYHATHTGLFHVFLLFGDFAFDDDKDGDKQYAIPAADVKAYLESHHFTPLSLEENTWGELGYSNFVMEPFAPEKVITASYNAADGTLQLTQAERQAIADKVGISDWVWEEDSVTQEQESRVLRIFAPWRPLNTFELRVSDSGAWNVFFATHTM